MIAASNPTKSVASTQEIPKNGTDAAQAAGLSLQDEGDEGTSAGLQNSGQLQFDHGRHSRGSSTQRHGAKGGLHGGSRSVALTQVHNEHLHTKLSATTRQVANTRDHEIAERMEPKTAHIASREKSGLSLGNKWTNVTQFVGGAPTHTESRASARNLRAKSFRGGATKHEQFQTSRSVNKIATLGDVLSNPTSQRRLQGASATGDSLNRSRSTCGNVAKRLQPSGAAPAEQV